MFPFDPPENIGKRRVKNQKYQLLFSVTEPLINVTNHIKTVSEGNIGEY